VKIASASNETVNTNGGYASSSGTASAWASARAISVACRRDVFAKVAGLRFHQVLKQRFDQERGDSANTLQRIAQFAGRFEGGISITPFCAFNLRARTEATLGTFESAAFRQRGFLRYREKQHTREWARMPPQQAERSHWRVVTISVLNDSTSPPFSAARAIFRNVRVSATGHSSLKFDFPR
jgi:hypothetical protein